MKQFLILSLLVLSACAEEKRFDRVFTPSFLVKEQSLLLENRMEATPFMWGGELHLLSSHRELSTDPFLKGELEIYDSEMNLVSSFKTNVKFASALVVGGELVVIGTYANQVLKITTSDLLNWSEEKKVISEIPGRTLYNTSFIQRADGSYLMALETCEPNTACFNVRFFSSSDLETWQEVGKPFSLNEYAACPTIREIEGVIYMIYLKDVGHWASYLVRSSDLEKWQNGNQVFLSALGTEGEENNASDVDLIEFGDEVLVNYAVGNQLTYSHIKRARYQGTLKSLFEKFF